MPARGVSIFCPHCHRHTSIEPAPVEVERGYTTFRLPAVWKQSHNSVWWIGVCNYCKSPVLAQNEGVTVYPHPLPQPTDAHVPEHIRADLDEAKQCFAVSCWRAAAIMARRTMQSAAIEKGAVNGPLGDQIAELAAKGKITVDLKEWADVVRWVGNDAAHPGGQPVTREDAEEVLKLAEQFLHVLYVAPAMAKKLRTKRGK
jgi:hypothetical protein